MITQASRGAKADRLDTAADYIAGLVNCSRQALVDSFMAGPGKMALFEIEKDDQRKALGVKLAVFRSMPVLITQIMTVGRERGGGGDGGRGWFGSWCGTGPSGDRSRIGSGWISSKGPPLPGCDVTDHQMRLLAGQRAAARHRSGDGLRRAGPRFRRIGKTRGPPIPPFLGEVIPDAEGVGVGGGWEGRGGVWGTVVGVWVVGGGTVMVRKDGRSPEREVRGRRGGSGEGRKWEGDGRGGGRGELGEGGRERNGEGLGEGRGVGGGERQESGDREGGDVGSVVERGGGMDSVNQRLRK